MALIGLTRSLSNKHQQQQQRDIGGAEATATRLHTSWNRFESARDLAKLKKRLAHAFEKLSASGSGASIKESPAEEQAAAAATG